MRYSGSVIEFGSRRVDLRYPILQVISAEGKHFVRLQLERRMPKQLYTRNVFAFDDNGEMLWQIQAVPGESQFHSWADIWFENGKLYAYDMSGFDIEIRMDTGEWIKGSGTGKFYK